MSRHPRIAAALTAAVTGTCLALAIPASGSAAPDDHRPDRAAPEANRAPVHGTAQDDRYIVVFDKGSTHRQVRSARSDARGNGATIHATYRTVIDGFAATLPPRALRGLRNNPHVAYLEADQPVHLADTESPATWGLDRSDQRSLPLDNSYTYAESGAGVTAYIIDTGIRNSHQEFSGRASSGYTAISDGRGTDDCNGHGTHVAGTVGGETYGVAQDVDLVAVRVLGCNGSGTTSGVIAGVDWVAEDASGPSVANMSLGGGASTSLDNAVSGAIDAGVTFAVAAGNDYGADACDGSPSRVAPALTVGSSTSTDSRSNFSNIGPCLDLFAPGSSITSAWIDSDTDTNTISGTSMATPHVAGAAALFLEANPGASPASVNAAIVDSATSGALSDVGSGSPNLLLYSNLDGSDPEPEPDPDPTCGDLPEGATGTLSGSGDVDYHPAPDGYFYTGAGTHLGCLSGPSSADFDLYLEKWNGWGWSVVAQSISSDSEEEISYSGTSGYYSWRVESWSGSGSYDFGFARP